VLIQRPAGQAGKQDAKKTEGVVVAPSLARVEGERKLSQPGDPFVCSQRQRLGSGLRPVLRPWLARAANRSSTSRSRRR
jgi:hypothetical protein